MMIEASYAYFLMFMGMLYTLKEYKKAYPIQMAWIIAMPWFFAANSTEMRFVFGATIMVVSVILNFFYLAENIQTRKK